MAALYSTASRSDDQVTSGIAKCVTRIAVISSVVLTSLVATAERSTSESESEDADRCEYTNFTIFRNHPDYQHGEDLASEAITWAVEDIFARELELVGFQRVAGERTPWLILRAVLMPSLLKPGSVSGVVVFVATAGLNRDFAYEPSDELIPPSGIEMVVPVEIDLRPRGGGLGSRVALQRFAKSKASWIWAEIEPNLSALCAWRRELIDDGLTLEDLQRELANGRFHIRSESRAGRRGDPEGTEKDP